MSSVLDVTSVLDIRGCVKRPCHRWMYQEGPAVLLTVDEGERWTSTWTASYAA